MRPKADLFSATPAGSAAANGIKTAILRILPSTDGAYALPGQDVESNLPEYRDNRMYGRSQMTLTVLRSFVLFAAGDERSSDPVKRDNEVKAHWNDISQGAFGNCGLQAALMALAAAFPNTLTMQATNQNGLISMSTTGDGEVQFTVYLYDSNGQTVQRTERFRLDRGRYSGELSGDVSVDGSPEIWHILLEDALEDYLGGWGQEGGHFAKDVWQTLTGRSARTVAFDRRTATDDHIWNVLNNQRGAALQVVISTHRSGAVDLTSNHYYFVEDWQADYIVLRNPWGAEVPPINLSKEMMAENIAGIEFLD